MPPYPIRQQHLVIKAESAGPAHCSCGGEDLLCHPRFESRGVEVRVRRRLHPMSCSVWTTSGDHHSESVAKRSAPSPVKAKNDEILLVEFAIMKAVECVGAAP